MPRHSVGLSIVMMLSLAASLAFAAVKEKENTKSGGSEAKGGASAHREPQGNEGKQQPGHATTGEPQGAHDAKSGGTIAPGGEWSDRTHGGKQSTSQSGNHNDTQASGKEGAAAGAATAKHNEPQASGAQGAAAGAAAAKHNEPQASGCKEQPPVQRPPNTTSRRPLAQGAAAGAAAVKHNEPQASGAQGAAAGAAVAKHNEPQYSGAQGAAAGAAVANRNAPAVSGAAGATAGYAAVKNSFHDPNLYGQQWYAGHQGAWAASGWAAGSAWQPSTWGAVAGLCGYGSVTPVSYDYGVNVIAQNGNVIVNGQNVGTTAEFSQQAAELAAAGTNAQTASTDQWLPLGVFAMVRDEHQQPRFIVQLAINKQGILRGNYTDENSKNTMTIHGAVDKPTQRAAWTVGDNQETVMEAGLNDLTEGEAPALIHKSGKTDHWILVRLEQPK